MKLTLFWERMREQFGPLAETFARDHVLSELGQRTVSEALTQGEPARRVWQAVCVEMDVPQRLR